MFSPLAVFILMLGSIAAVQVSGAPVVATRHHTCAECLVAIPDVQNALKDAFPQLPVWTGAAAVPSSEHSREYFSAPQSLITVQDIEDGLKKAFPHLPVFNGEDKA
ncbi:hypothetical protein MKEN_00188900 [Mycena kentingensis (nom. inval.)]|nr:hypothetical protein MKEN_00188900 [Mycena kentingensis (nom. inval.)]